MRLRSGFVGLIAVASLVACSAPASIFDPPADASYLRIGVKYDQPYTGYFEHGTYSGFDVQLANFLAEAFDKRPTLSNVSSDTRDAGLTTKPGAEPRWLDMVVASYSITTPREDHVDFAGPYIITHQGVLVRRDDDKGIRTRQDLKGKTICTAKGTTSAELLESLEGPPRQETDFSKCVEALGRGEIDGMSTDLMILYGFVKKYPDRFAVVPDIKMGTNYYGVALPKGYPDDCRKVRDQIRKFITSSKWDQVFEDELALIPDRMSYKPDVNVMDKYSCKAPD